METISNSPTKCVEGNKVEDFHEFLRAYTDIFTKNIYATKDFTYNNLKNIINKDKLAIVSGDKDSCVVIMTREDYNDMLEVMLNDGISKSIYARTENTTLRDLKLLKIFYIEILKMNMINMKKGDQPVMNLENSAQQQKLMNSIC